MDEAKSAHWIDVLEFLLQGIPGLIWHLTLNDQLILVGHKFG